MTNRLTSALLLILVTITVSAQTTVISNELTAINDVVFNVENTVIDVKDSLLKDNSYNNIESHHCHSHSKNDNHIHIESNQELVIMDSVMQSDEGTDFNCSGGFCMDHTHFHKKGLTLKRQLFDYFLKISC